MCFVSYEQNQLLVYAKGDSIKLIFDPDAKNQVKACAVNFFLLDSSAFPSPLAVEAWAESSLNCFLLGSVTLPVVDNTFDQSGQDNYKLLDKSNITAHLVLSIYHHRELSAIRS